MPSLLQSFQDHDLGYLRIVLELWGFGFIPKDALDAAKYLSMEMEKPQFSADLMDSLSPSARQALDTLHRTGGIMPVADFTRKFGPIREMGPGRRDREKPWRSPASPLEVLWYRGLVGRTFIDTPMGAQEVLYIPEELKINLPETKDAQLAVNSPSQIEPESVLSGSQVCVDDGTTLLAFLRRRMIDSRKHDLTDCDPFLFHPSGRGCLLHCLQELNLVDPASLEPNPGKVGEFLELTYSEAHHNLILAWAGSQRWNDLAQVPGISVKGGSWQNDPLESRSRILQVLKQLPENQWWDIRQFAGYIKETIPSFQRPAGDFESWYLIRKETGEFLQGFEHWEDVEGAYLRSLIMGPLFWLGLVDLGMPVERAQANMFRLNEFSKILLHSENVHTENRKPETATIDQDGTIRVPRRTVRAHRYQLARIADWIALHDDTYSFRLSPASLENARNQQLNEVQVRTILESLCERVPSQLLQALERWDSRGKEASLRLMFSLQVSSPEVLDELLTNRFTAKFIHERLGPTTALVAEREKERLYAAALKNGILIDLE